MTAWWGTDPSVCICALATWIASSGSALAYTVKQTGSGAVVRWHRDSVTLRLDASMHAYFRELPVPKAVAEAAEAWIGLPSVPELLISEGPPDVLGVPSGGDNSNGVYLIKDWALAESSLAVTVATFESRTGRIVDTDILVNANHPFGVMPNGPDQRAEAFDLTGVLTHEMGHVLGLGESFDVRSATMWPNIARGETHQRDLDIDDVTGATHAYDGPMLLDADSAGGCGGSSVVVHRPRAHGVEAWILAGLSLLGAGLWLRRRPRHKRSAALSALGLVLLFAAPFEPGIESTSDHERVSVLRTLTLRRMGAFDRHRGLTDAVHAKSVPVRMAAAAVLERVGTREELGLAAQLAVDPNPDVRAAAGRALARLRTAPPATRLSARDPEAVRRVAAFIAGAVEVVDGEVVQVGTEMRSGLAWSRFLVHGKDRMVTVDIPGGSIGDYTQVVSGQEPPDDGDRIVVALRVSGPHAWAHLRDGAVYGGFLGDGAAIAWPSR